MRVLLTGGGTAGHLFPGLAIAEELSERIPCQFLFIGTKHGVESRIVPERMSFRTVWISGLHRKRFLKNILFPLKMAVSFIQAILLVHRFNPNLVLGTGGFVSWPVLMAGIVLCKTTVIQEQNRAPGLVTKMLAPWVDSIHVSFSESRNYFRNPEKVHLSGNPTRKDIIKTKKDGYRYFDLSPKKKTVFIFGGSQGSLVINQAVLKGIDSLLYNKDVQVLWSVGPRWFDKIRSTVNPYQDRIRLFPFIADMGLAYSVSDLVICRAGATTLAEVTYLGLPVVFIPLSTAAGAHQEKNARLLWEAGAAEMVLENDLSTDRFTQIISSLLQNTRKRKAMGQRAREFAQPNAAKNIVDDIIKQMHYSQQKEVSSSTTIY
jgi:UDP-N-acetylglucosamine--N-acetylmuramyl-(pentapeptide) pyrophosphoryl-undecaprenol N-acetylglucosamine transferase